MSNSSFHRQAIFDTLLSRLREDPARLQVLSGPRQVGKTTVVLQALEALETPNHYASADDPTLRDSAWLEAQWEEGRRLAHTRPAGATLAIDEIQKVGGWAETVKPIQLATVSTMVPGFTSVTETELEVPCTYDLEVASARYLRALDESSVPLLLLFSGTVFIDNGDRFSVELIPWSSEASCRLPVSAWKDVVDEHFPGSAWLRCTRETLDALAAFKTARALPTWDATLNALLAEAGQTRDDAPASPTSPGGAP